MRILLVDDSSFVLMVGRRNLEAAGHQIVGECFDGESAIQAANRLRPDLVIVDIALPKKNGFEVSAKILEDNAEIAVLAISAIAEDWVKDKALESGCYEFLAKPFDSGDLVKAAERSKDSKRSLRYG